MLSAAVELFPVLSRLRMLRHWGGIVDTCPDASPIISKTDIEGLYFDCGWGTGGFKATPGSGHVFADLIANDRPNAIAAPYALDRFGTGLLIDEHGRWRGPLTGIEEFVMLLIDCPFCGPRDESEFSCGGEAHIMRPLAENSITDVEFADYLFMRDNPKGLFLERWRHSTGCRRWFNVARDSQP